MDDEVRGEQQKGGMAETDRRTLLRTAGLAGAAGAALAGAMHGKFSLAPVTAAQAQTATSMPKGTDKPWWPSKWGKDDEAGASNHITPAKVLDAAKWIKDGKIYKIGRVYEQGMPLFGARVFALRIPGSPTGGPFGRLRSGGPVAQHLADEAFAAPVPIAGGGVDESAAEIERAMEGGDGVGVGLHAPVRTDRPRAKADFRALDPVFSKGAILHKGAHATFPAQPRNPAEPWNVS